MTNPPSLHNVNQTKEKIDIVYLWVDGADPVWHAKRQSAIMNSPDVERKKLAVYGDVAGRYRDNQELRFNLRALEKFFPEHGHIYLVTDGQTPQWLRKTKGFHADRSFQHYSYDRITCI